MPQEFDEFGIPIKKTATSSKQEEVDEFGIPIKKKEPTPSSGQQGGSPYPSASKPSNTAVPQSQVQPVKPTSAWQAAKPATPEANCAMGNPVEALRTLDGFETSFSSSEERLCVAA